MINFFIELISPKIKLRPLLIEDYDHFLLLTSDPKMWYYFTSDLSTGSELEKWIEQAISERDLQKRIPFTIIEQKSGKIIGSTINPTLIY